MPWYGWTMTAAFLLLVLACRLFWRAAGEQERMAALIAPNPHRDRRRTGRPLLVRLSAFAQTYLDRSGAKLDALLWKAGRPAGLTPTEWVGGKVLLIGCTLPLALLTALLGLGAGPSLGVFLLGGVAGWLGPDWWLLYRAGARHTEMVAAIPPFLETLSWVLRAGVPLESALERVAANLGGPLGQEWGRALQEVQMRVAPETVYRNLAARIGSEDADVMVQVLLQASALGVSVAETLEQQARLMREAQRSRALERASKAGPKVAMITTMVTTPTVFLFVLGITLYVLVSHMSTGFLQ